MTETTNNLKTAVAALKAARETLTNAKREVLSLFDELKASVELIQSEDKSFKAPWEVVPCDHSKHHGYPLCGVNAQVERELQKWPLGRNATQIAEAIGYSYVYVQAVALKQLESEGKITSRRDTYGKGRGNSCIIYKIA